MADAPKLPDASMAATYTVDIAPGSFFIKIGDTKYVVPAGPTREQAQSVIDESIRRLQECAAKSKTFTATIEDDDA
jgi:hypothetical protein